MVSYPIYKRIYLKFLGFKYIAYEHTHPNIHSLNMLKREQTWSQVFLDINKKDIK